MNPGLTFEFQWQAAESVRSPELRATWARFRLLVGEDCLTVVEDTETGEFRDWLDVSVYPLAEWVAFNWWFLITPANPLLVAHPFGTGLGGAAWPYSNETDTRFSLAGAGSGFPWPNLVLVPEQTCYVASLSATPRSLNRVAFRNSGDFVLDRDATIRALSTLVDSTCRRLDDQGVSGTPLQSEWSAIVQLEPDEREFCAAAATLGLDAFDMAEGESVALETAAKVTDDPALFLELLAAIDPRQVSAGADWLAAALDRLAVTLPTGGSSRAASLREQLAKPAEAIEWPSVRAPWASGYRRAGTVRELLGLAPEARTDIDALVSSATIQHPVPRAIEALGSSVGEGPTVVVGQVSSRPASRRFKQARALSRYIFDGAPALFVVAQSPSLRDRAERAFAAELLAPAAGLELLLDDNFDAADRERAAEHFEVSRYIIDHQLENQLGVPATW